MLFGGFQPFTLSDYPGCVAAIAFAQGCNFRCPFCHNGALIPLAAPKGATRGQGEVLTALEARRGKLEGLVVSGGEPTIHGDLPDFLRQVKRMGFRVKLDTNGSKPNMLAALIEDGLVDYLAMDIKAPLEDYKRLCGVNADTRALEESIAIISWSKLPHHFRTTAVTPLLTPADMHAVKSIVPGASKHIVQPFKPEHALDPALRDMVAIA